MLKLLDIALKYIPQQQWNLLSDLLASLSLQKIENPIAFKYKELHLQEYQTNSIPKYILEKFLDFCYPMDIPDRLQQITMDKKLYWEDTTTFIVFKNDSIVGCIQIINRTSSVKLPVEFAIQNKKDNFKIESFIPLNSSVTEIYRNRRSFNLTKKEVLQVMLMLFKAIWAKTVQLNTAYSVISFDSSKRDLHHLYCNKLDFYDPHIILTFDSCPTQWSFLLKDWASHEKFYVNKDKNKFYMQTWVKSGLKCKHLPLTKNSRVNNDGPRKSNLNV
jgi:hypothetical protein